MSSRTTIYLSVALRAEAPRAATAAAASADWTPIGRHRETPGGYLKDESVESEFSYLVITSSGAGFVENRAYQLVIRSA